jgi:hypothetical protein
MKKHARWCELLRKLVRFVAGVVAHNWEYSDSILTKRLYSMDPVGPPSSSGIIMLGEAYGQRRHLQDVQRSEGGVWPSGAMDATPACCAQA